MRPTIFAPLTITGRSALSAIRISGPDAAAAVLAMAGTPLPEARQVTLRTLRSPSEGEVLDRGLVIWFPGPESFTGEDVAELHLHGGRAVLTAMLEALGGLPSLRLAQPGEFSRRAFDNGKLDLAEAEAIADLVDAETSAQRRQALRQLDGALGRAAGDWSARLTRCLAHLEAALDFADEDLPENLIADVVQDLGALAGELDRQLDDVCRGERLRDGFSVAILGAPNAGKSSLLNALARRDAAIVSERAGTTRDVIEVHLDLEGLPVVLADTAGLRESADEVEEEGIRRARARAAQADMKLLVFDASRLPDRDPATTSLMDDESLSVFTKADLLAGPSEGSREVPGLFVSALTGAGMSALVERLKQQAANTLTGGESLITRARHREAFSDCRNALRRAVAAPRAELLAEDVRLALRALGRVTGQVDVEDLLDVIFRDFCIGK